MVCRSNLGPGPSILPKPMMHFAYSRISTKLINFPLISTKFLHSLFPQNLRLFGLGNVFCASPYFDHDALRIMVKMVIMPLPSTEMDVDLLVRHCGVVSAKSHQGHLVLLTQE